MRKMKKKMAAMNKKLLKKRERPRPHGRLVAMMIMRMTRMPKRRTRRRRR